MIILIYIMWNFIYSFLNVNTSLESHEIEDWFEIKDKIRSVDLCKQNSERNEPENILFNEQ